MFVFSYELLNIKLLRNHIIVVFIFKLASHDSILSMLMLPFSLVIICGHFEYQRTSVYPLHISVLSLEVQLSRVCWKPITCLKPPHFYDCPKLWFPTSFVVVMFVLYISVRGGCLVVHFVNISRIVACHCLHFLFLIDVIIPRVNSKKHTGNNNTNM